MVQIILYVGEDGVHAKVELYIPHGSDNTKGGEAIMTIICMLYIPHGSDNTR